MSPGQKPPPLRELQFGELDASLEAVDSPELLTKGFYDYREAAYGIAARRVWVLLGPKGAGKSAVLEHLKLEWLEREDRFFDYWDVRTFPVNDVTRIQTGQTAGAARAQSAWEFLLLLRVIASLDADQALEAPTSFSLLRDELRHAGLIGADYKAKVAEWSKWSVKVDLKVLQVGTERSEEAAATPLEISAALRAALSESKTPNQHVVALDGLDSFFFEAEDEWVSLAGLMHAIESLNRYFRGLPSAISIVAAVRSDIFDVLPSAELNKLKPRSVHLDWSALGIGAGNHLWRLVTAKAAVGRPELKDLVATYLSTPIYIGPHTVMAEFLLDNTRLLPRDLVALMGYMQQSHPGASPVTEVEVKSAVGRYCSEYFEGEIFDNLAGILPPGSGRKLTSFRDAMRSLPTRIFTFDDVQSEVQGELEPSETKALLRQMFEVGGIGIRNESGRVEHTDFVYRRISGGGFTTRYGFLLHDALTRAWNRPWR